MPINRLILEIEKILWPLTWPIFIDCHPFLSIFFDCHREKPLLSMLTKSCQYTARPFEDCLHLYPDILGIPMYPARCRWQSIAIDAINWNFVFDYRLVIRYQLTNNYRLISIVRLISDHRLSSIGHPGRKAIIDSLELGLVTHKWYEVTLSCGQSNNFLSNREYHLSLLGRSQDLVYRS